MYNGYNPCYFHAAPDRYFTFALNHSGGIAFKWYRDTLGGDEIRLAQEQGKDPFEIITNSMNDNGPSPVFFLPHLGGSGTPTCDTHSRGTIAGLSFATTRHDISKALLEGLCFELRANTETMLKAGIQIDRLAAVGGGAKSATWLQMKADILARPIQTLQIRESACLGASILAGTAAGIHSSVQAGVDSAVRIDATFEPRPGITDAYNERYKTYSELYPAMKGIYRT